MKNITALMGMALLFSLTVSLGSYGGTAKDTCLKVELDLSDMTKVIVIGLDSTGKKNHEMVQVIMKAFDISYVEAEAMIIESVIPNDIDIKELPDRLDVINDKLEFDKAEYVEDWDPDERYIYTLGSEFIYRKRFNAIKVFDYRSDHFKKGLYQHIRS